MNKQQQQQTRALVITTPGAKLLSQNQQRKPKPRPKGPARSNHTVKASVAQTRVMRTGAPNFSRRPNGDIIVSHREFITDIPGSVDYNVTKIPVNPGLPFSFPWLSQMASLYESYCFEKLDFEFETMSSTSTTGSVMLAVDYDASDPTPVEKSQLASYQDYKRSSPWESFKQHSSAQNLHKRSTFNVREGALSANQDVKLYDTGNLFVSTQGQANGNAVGELYVDYRVKLMTPQLNNPALGNSKYAKFSGTSGAPVLVSATGSNAPLIPSGSITGPTTLTATSAYQGLVSIYGTVATGTPVAPALSGSSTRSEQVTLIGAENNYAIDLEVSWLAGQTLTFTPAPTATSVNIRVGQYSVAL